MPRPDPLGSIADPHQWGTGLLVVLSRVRGKVRTVHDDAGGWSSPSEELPPRHRLTTRHYIPLESII